MASTITTRRRPLPALVALLALLLLTALVWWRVLNRSDGKPTEAKPCPTVAPAVVLPAPSAVTLQILNSTTRTGIAGKASSVFAQLGFNVPAPAANDNRKLLNKIRTTAQIRYGPAQARSARLVAYYLPGSTLVPTASKSPVVIVSLGTGYRSVASQATVAAQLKRDHVVAGTPAPIASGSCASSS